MKTSKNLLKDATGIYLDRDTVKDIAIGNIIASGEGSKGVAMDSYIENMDDATLIQWATDVNGNFPAHRVKYPCS
jgi:hypothetical protein